MTVFGVSADSVKSHQKFAQKHHLTFPLLSDEGAAVCRLYGVWGERSFLGKKYMGIARTTFYIRPDGVIGHVWEGVKPANHGREVLEYLKAQG